MTRLFNFKNFKNNLVKVQKWKLQLRFIKMILLSKIKLFVVAEKEFPIYVDSIMFSQTCEKIR
jgi:hypothetical protein